MMSSKSAKTWNDNVTNWWLENVKPGVLNRDPDLWAYHPVFEAMCDRCRAEIGRDYNNGYMHHCCVGLRKLRFVEKSPRDRLAKTKDPYFIANATTTEQSRWLYLEWRKTKISRDRFSYTKQWLDLYDRFCKRFGSTVDKHNIWRALVNADKSGKYKQRRLSGTFF